MRIVKRRTLAGIAATLLALLMGAVSLHLLMQLPRPAPPSPLWLAIGCDGAPLTVAAYCQDFARTFCDEEALTYQEQSVHVTPYSAMMRWLSNLFQPSDSTFTAGYECAFRARTQAGQVQSITVGLFLTKTAHFAEHTHWPGLQLIPITYVRDETTGRAGYGVFKYLEQDAP